MDSLTDAKKLRNERAERIIESILEGNSLRKAVAEVGIGLRTFHNWISGDRDLAMLYARAREMLMDAEVDEAKELADSDGDPAKVRNQVDIRKWRATKLAAKTYGERIDLNVTQTLDIGATLAEAKARLLRPVSYQLEAQDAQVIDLPRQIMREPSDKQSETRPGPDDVPDIFG